MTRLIPVQPNSRAYRLKTPLEIYETEWTLTELEQDNLSNYALRKWSIKELLDMMQFAEDGIHLTVRLWNVVYSAHVQVSAKMYSILTYHCAKQHGWRDPINDKQPMFWLSFRAGKWEGQDFAYVIVQEEKGNKPWVKEQVGSG